MKTAIINVACGVWGMAECLQAEVIRKRQWNDFYAAVTLYQDLLWKGCNKRTAVGTAVSYFRSTARFA